METTSPFKALQDLQNEQREGWMPASNTPETDEALVDHMPANETEWSEHYLKLSIYARKLERERDEARQALSGRTVSCSQCNEAVKKLDEKDAAIAELNQRLTEQRESFMSQLVRIEDGWRLKLVESRRDADRLYNALLVADDDADGTYRTENGHPISMAMFLHENLASNH